MSLRKSSSNKNGSKSDVLPNPNARRRCTPAPSMVGLDVMSRLTGRMDMAPQSLRRRGAGSREPGQRIAVERPRLPGLLVPLALAADHLDGHDRALRAQLVCRGDAVIEAAGGVNRELNRARQLVCDQDLDFILARVLRHGE